MEETQRLKLWLEIDDYNFGRQGGIQFRQEHADSLACTRDESPFAVGDKVIPKLKGIFFMYDQKLVWPQTITGIKEVHGYTYAGEAFVYTKETPTGIYAAALKLIIPALAVEEERENWVDVALRQAINGPQIEETVERIKKEVRRKFERIEI